MFEEDIDLGVDEHSIRHNKSYSNNQESGYSENSPISYTTSDHAINLLKMI